MQLEEFSYLIILIKTYLASHTKTRTPSCGLLNIHIFINTYTIYKNNHLDFQVSDLFLTLTIIV